MRKVRTHSTERTPTSRGDPESQALGRCKAALDALDAARRSSSGVTSAEYRRNFSLFVELRGKLGIKERQIADEYSQTLWKQFGIDLEAETTEAATRPGQAKRVDSTPTGREARATVALPGTPGKLATLQHRRRLGMPLHADGDVTESFEVGFRPPPAPKGMDAAIKARVVASEEVRQTVEKIQRLDVDGFPHRLRAARRAIGWDQATLARRAEVRQQTISAMERGLRRPSIDTARRLAECLGVSVDALLGVAGARGG